MEREFAKNECIAYEKGYRIVDDCKIKGPRGIRKLLINDRGYHCFTVSIEGRTRSISCHRFQAYIKYGDSIYEEGRCVRHLNSNRLDFTSDNIALGTHSDNMMDIPMETRVRSARIAARSKRRFSDDDIREIRRLKTEGWSLGKLSKEYKTSKGHLSDIVNRKLFEDII